MHGLHFSLADAADGVGQPRVDLHQPHSAADASGTALSPELAFVAHSCAPTAIIRLADADGATESSDPSPSKTVVLVAARALDAGTELSMQSLRGALPVPPPVVPPGASDGGPRARALRRQLTVPLGQLDLPGAGTPLQPHRTRSAALWRLRMRRCGCDHCASR